MGKSYKINVLKLTILCFVFNIGSKCGSNYEPDPIIYRSNVKVTYQRSANDITCPQCPNDLYLHYRLIDPNIGISSSFIPMTQVSADVFEGFLSKVYVQNEIDGKHSVWVEDPKLQRFDQNGHHIPLSWNTGKNIIIYRAYDVEVVDNGYDAGSTMRFKMK